MSDNFENVYNVTKKKGKYSFIINVFLFILTFFSTTLSGVGWLNQNPYALENFALGLQYSFLILTVISLHEFGHYFAAKYHKVDVTLPYYIPFPFLFLNPFGTMGAVIKMKSPTQTRKSLFDIGIAGPIAGWIASMAILIYGFMTLPKIDYLFNIHPEYLSHGIPTTGLTFGNNLIFLLFQKIFSHGAFVPPMNEMYHYPFLCVGWFGLLITSLNMMPVGQLDGGHISYTMFGKNHKIIAYLIFILLIIFGLLGLLPLLNIQFELGSINWLVWAVLIYFVIKIEHPPICTDMDKPLDRTRMILGWFSFLIFITSFCPVPINEL
jgi:membrane-associated protease RseP (regulator of RpoE activity)